MTKERAGITDRGGSEGRRTGRGETPRHVRTRACPKVRAEALRMLCWTLAGELGSGWAGLLAAESKNTRPTCIQNRKQHLGQVIHAFFEIQVVVVVFFNYLLVHIS